jgi:serine/threonine protein kinase
LTNGQPISCGGAMMASRVGQQLGNYRLLRLLGRGAFAEVYLSVQRDTGTQVAVKVLDDQLPAADIARFRNEGRVIAALDHPHIVRLLELDAQDNVPFLVMEYAPHGTLRDRHPQGTQVPLVLVVQYVRQIADALQYAHDRSWVHRDLKPENVLLGAQDEVLLSDFGVALLVQHTSTLSKKEVAGTAAYMAPEQIESKPRPASDQYALGVMVYEWLAGERPFEGTPLELYGKHLYATPPPLSEKVPTISPAVEEVVLTALAKDPRQRFASVAAFAYPLEQASQGGFAGLLFEPTQVNPSGTVLSPTLVVSSTQPPTSGRLTSGVTQAATTVPQPATTLPAAGVPRVSTASFSARTPPGGSSPHAPPVPTPGARRRRRGLLVSALLAVLALAMIGMVSAALSLSGTSGSRGNHGATATSALLPTWTPTGQLSLAHGTPSPSPSGAVSPTPSGTASPTPTWTLTPTGTVGVTPTDTPGPVATATSTPLPTDTPTATPGATCTTPSGASYFDDFSNDTPGQPPNGYLLRGASGVNATVQEVGGSGPAYRLLNFPAVSNQYWDRWVLESGLMLCSAYTITVKINFQTSGDRGGLTIAWNDANWDRIDIQPNIFYQNIEFRITYTGSVPASPSVTGPALNRYSLPMNVGSDYWLRVVASSAGPGQGQVVVYWSSDGINFTSEVTATGLANIAGLVGMSTAGPNLPNVYFDNFQCQEN